MFRVCLASTDWRLDLSNCGLSQQNFWKIGLALFRAKRFWNRARVSCLPIRSRPKTRKLCLWTEKQTKENEIFMPIETGFHESVSNLSHELHIRLINKKLGRRNLYAVALVGIRKTYMLLPGTTNAKSKTARSLHCQFELHSTPRLCWRIVSLFIVLEKGSKALQ